MSVDNTASVAAATSDVEMAVETNEEKKNVLLVKLESSDNCVFEVEKDVAFKSRLIQAMMTGLKVDANDERLNDSLELHNVDAKTLKKILEYCEKYKNVEYVPKGDDEDTRVTLTEDDKAYLDVSGDDLVDILLVSFFSIARTKVIVQGANYLDIPGIVDIVTQKIADLTIGKTVEQLRKLFGVQNDFSEQEQKENKDRFFWVQI